MLAFFRRALGSWIVVALFGLIVLAFVLTGTGTPSALGGGPSPDTIATVGGRQVTGAELSQRIQNQYAQARQQQPDLTMAAFIAGSGGINAMVDQYLTARMLEVWGEKKGLVASDRLVDGEIAGIAAFQGVNGRFDESRMQQVLAQQRLTLDGLRTSIRGDLIRRELVVPITAGAAAPAGLVTPYAGLIAARREGQLALIPYKPAAVPPPTATEIAAWYKGNAARYSVPERRVIRYAPLSLDSMTPAMPSDQAVAAQYKADAAKYAASEKRALKQVVLPDEAAARAFSTKVAGGTPFDIAATAAGFAAADTALGTLARTEFAAASSPAIADAAFALKQGGSTAPIRSALGWHVVHVVSIETTPARSLAEVRGEILGALIKTAKADALAKAIEKIDGQLGDGASFDEVVKANGLTATTTPPITADGKAPGDPAYQADATVQALVKTAFQAAPDDAPTLETVGTDGGSALLGIARVQPATALPLEQVRERVVADLTFFRATQAARATAQAILAKADAGKGLAAALAEAGYAAPKPIAMSQLELRGQQQPLPAPVRAFFTLAPSRSVVAADRQGIFIVRLDRIADPAPQLVQALSGQIRDDIGRSIGNEYVEQFANAARRDLTIRKNPAAIEALGRQLLGQAPAAGQ